MHGRVTASCVLVACALMQGCSVARSVPLSEIRPSNEILLTLRDSFLLRQAPEPPSASVLESRVIRLTAQFEGVRGDTLLLRDVRIREGDRLDTRWRADRPGYVVLSDYPQLRPEVYRYSSARTQVLGLVVIAVWLCGSAERTIIVKINC